MSKNHANYKPWPERHAALLGTMTDAALAAKIGRSYRAVESKRRKLGILPFDKRKHFKLPKKYVVILGHIPDSRLAEQAGVSRKFIFGERKKRGIGPARPENSPNKKR